MVASSTPTGCKVFFFNIFFYMLGPYRVSLGAVLIRHNLEVVYLAYSVEAQLRRIILWYTAIHEDDCD